MNRVWKRVSAEHIDRLSVGTIKLRFRLHPDGRVSHVETVSHSGSKVLARVAILTIERTEIPPIPAAVLQELPDRYMAGDVDFNITPPSR